MVEHLVSFWGWYDGEGHFLTYEAAYSLIEPISLSEEITSLGCFDTLEEAANAFHYVCNRSPQDDVGILRSKGLKPFQDDEVHTAMPSLYDGNKLLNLIFQPQTIKPTFYSDCKPDHPVHLGPLEYYFTDN